MRRLGDVVAWGVFALNLFIFSPAALADKRVALVIGNAAYKESAALSNTRNDALDIVGVLKRLDFDVMEGVDLNKRAMERLIREFDLKLRGVDIALFFYAGHGLQVSGQNYLIPIDARLLSESDVDFESVPLDLVLKRMERQTKTSIVLLDACRDNPLARNLAGKMGTRGGQVGQGLSRIESGIGTLIGFSTQPGNTALDGDGRNSPYTSALLTEMERPGRDLLTTLAAVRGKVVKATDGKQVPWEHTSLLGPVVLKDEASQQHAGARPSGSPSPPSYSPPFYVGEAAQTWQLIESLQDVSLFEAFRKQFGASNPVYDHLAANKIASLKQAQAQQDRLAALKVEEGKKQSEAKRVADEKAAAEAEREREAEEAKRQAEAKRLAEKAAAEAERVRKSEEAKKQAEAKRLADEKAAVEAKRLAEEKSAAEAKRLVEDAKKQAEARRLAEEKAAAEAERVRKAEEARKQAEAKRLAEEKAAADAKRLIEETKKQAEARRLAEEKAAAEADRVRRAEEARKQAEAKRLAEEKAAAETKRLAEERARKAAEEARKAEAKSTADEAKAAERTKLAALGNQPIAPALPEANSERQVRAAQAELQRIGCYSGPGDGRLSETTKDAIQRYLSRLERKAKIEITDEFVAELKGQARVCPLVCPQGQAAQGDQCIAKATPEKSERVKPAQKRPAKEEPRQASKPQRRDNDAPPRARQREAGPATRSGGGGTMTGVGF